jgi:hypothetical protein
LPTLVRKSRVVARCQGNIRQHDVPLRPRSSPFVVAERCGWPDGADCPRGLTAELATTELFSRLMDVATHLRRAVKSGIRSNRWASASSATGDARRLVICVSTAIAGECVPLRRASGQQIRKG